MDTILVGLVAAVAGFVAGILVGKANKKHVAMIVDDLKAELEKVKNEIKSVVGKK